MYLHTRNGKGEAIDAFPCYICKKMIINAGIEKMVCGNKDGGITIFNVKDWVDEWKQGDVLDDKYQYGSDQNKKENLS